MRMPTHTWVGTAVVALLCSPLSCVPVDSTPITDDNTPGLGVRSDKQRDLSPMPDRSDLELQVEGNTQFAFDMYNALRADSSDNLFFSPYSISIALAMTYAGAAGNTATQMADTLDFVLAQERLHPVFNALDLALNSRGQGAEGQDGEGFRLHVLNSIWGQDGYSFLMPFLDTLAVNYGAGLRLLDFAQHTEEARESINTWVEEQTESRIQELLPQGSLDSMTRLVLTNAIYFNAAWDKVFPEELTQAQTFTLLDGDTVQVPMMRQTASFKYLDTQDLQAVELPYDGGELAMLILLPAPGSFVSFEAQINAQNLAHIIDSLDEGELILGVPRWSFGTPSISLAEMFKQMGMADAFLSGVADFSGMNGTQELYIGDIFHKAFVSVDEKGTEAAAATAVVMEGNSVPDFPTIMCNRPFIYAIRDLQTGTVLFMGRVTQPTE